jgi:hypothetical protein
VGPTAGQKLFTLQTVPPRLQGLEGDPNGAARAGGFSLHAGVDIAPQQRDKNTGGLRAKVRMKAGDVAAMPADIRHQGYSRKRSMLLVWENATPGLPEMYETGKLEPYPIEF